MRTGGTSIFVANSVLTASTRNVHWSRPSLIGYLGRFSQSTLFLRVGYSIFDKVHDGCFEVDLELFLMGNSSSR